MSRVIPRRNLLRLLAGRNRRRFRLMTSEPIGTDVAGFEPQLVGALRTLRDALPPVENGPEDYAMCSIETYVAGTLRLITKSPPAVVRDCMRAVEIQARMDGLPVVKGVS